MIKIDTVYQKVLAIANKEQRGYVTPQDFNLFADHAQNEIFEQYFYDLNQFKRMPGNNTIHSDMVNNLEEKISLFQRYSESANVIGNYGDININVDFPNLYRLTTVRIKWQTEPGFRVAEEVQLTELNMYANSPLIKWSKKHPVYTRYSTNSNSGRVKIYPYPSSDVDVDRVQISYIKKPEKPNWNYIIVNEKPFFKNDSESENFELHPSDESELVYRILALAGVQVEKPQLTQVAMTLEAAKVQQEKQ
tara:strand:- start:1526 stop:2272 length:747 start_codon:yes stop_codon:yes gene_type:complete